MHVLLVKLELISKESARQHAFALCFLRETDAATARARAELLAAAGGWHAAGCDGVFRVDPTHDLWPEWRDTVEREGECVVILEWDGQDSARSRAQESGGSMFTCTAARA